MIRSIARRVRHLPRIERMDFLWDVLRPPYRMALGLGNGVRVSLGGCVDARLPVELACTDIEAYEAESIRAFVTWIRAHPSCTVIDIGCHRGLFCAAALFADDTADVFAIDSNIHALAAVRETCRYAPRHPSLLCVMLTDDAGRTTLSEAIAATREEINTGNAAGLDDYICFGDEKAEMVRHATLDDLFGEISADMIIKCDVEGAELHVLRGAARLIASRRPAILISVHPGLLPCFGHTPQALRAHLVDRHYRIELLAIDHEEHWFCTPRT
jgi:FkbM family methyltransferase